MNPLGCRLRFPHFASWLSGTLIAQGLDPLLHDGHTQIDAESHPDLGLDGIGRCFAEGLNPRLLPLSLNQKEPGALLSIKGH